MTQVIPYSEQEAKYQKAEQRRITELQLSQDFRLQTYI